jgi:hypothetical protein
MCAESKLLVDVTCKAGADIFPKASKGDVLTDLTQEDAGASYSP